MSGIAVVFNRNGKPAERDDLALMMGALVHRGPDGSCVHVRDSVAFGHLHFWTTPEEVGEQQPVSDPRDRFDVMFDGRLDNREELLCALGFKSEADRKMSDARLLLAAYEKWGDDCFSRLLGSFAIVVYDSASKRIICARDALGDRTLFYHINDRILLIASEESAILTHPAVSNRLDETTLVEFFAVRTPPDGLTFFADIREMLPAHALAIDADCIKSWRHWKLSGNLQLRYRSDDEYAEHFRALLTESVRCRLRCIGPPGVQMSGGLDSTSVAALAACELEKSGSQHKLRAISWVFDQFASCDEREYMDALIAQYDIEAIRFSGDDCWPLSQIESWAWNPNSPFENAYRRLKQQLYSIARNAGTRTLLTGAFGDHLYSGTEAWLADLLRERRFATAIRQAFQRIRRLGVRGWLSDPGIRHVCGLALDFIPLARRIRPRRLPACPHWLTEYALDRLPDEESELSVELSVRRPHQYKVIFGMRVVGGVSAETFHTSRAGVELRDPYRDRRLVEFMLSVPAHQLYNKGRYKHILRNAMSGVLPELIRNRTHPSLLSPLYAYGLIERETSTVEKLLSASGATWQRYVRAEWLPAAFENRVRAQIDGIEALIPWRCLSFERWRAGFNSQELDAYNSSPSKLAIA